MYLPTMLREVSVFYMSQRGNRLGGNCLQKKSYPSLFRAMDKVYSFYTITTAIRIIKIINDISYEPVKMLG